MANDDISEVLAKIDSWVKTNRPDYYAKLLPGATLAEISELETKFEITLPETFKMFLTWKNGQVEGSFDSFFANFGLMSVSEIADTLDMLNDLLDGGDFEQANWWNKQWVPFLQNHSGDHYCIDLTGSFEGQPGQMLIFWHDYEAREIFFPSFADFLRTALALFENMGYDVQKGEKYGRSREMIAQMNPGYPKRHEAG